MFRKQREFNIITGEIANNNITKRTRSCVSQLENFNKILPLKQNNHKLGIARDKKQFQYSYIESSLPQIHNKNQAQETLNKSHSIANSTLMNYVSTDYNIITHAHQISTSKIVPKQVFYNKIPEAFKKSPLTQHFHRARQYAPNYHEDYEQRTQKHEFYKKTGFCADTCGLQKTYGQSKYFRKLK